MQKHLNFFLETKVKFLVAKVCYLKLLELGADYSLVRALRANLGLKTGVAQ